MPTAAGAVKLARPKELRQHENGSMRICSFLPSATEMLYALGLGEAVAGVTYECDFPPEARQKPVVVHSRLPPTRTSAELDRQVRGFLARGESLYRLDTEELRRAAPDLIVTQDLCQVCAASPGDLGDLLTQLPHPPQVLSLSPRTLGDVLEDLRRVGQATGRSDAAEQLVKELESKLRQVEAAVADSATRPRVLCLEWLDPPYIGGHWVPEMVERVAGTPVLGRAGEPSRRVSWGEILDSQPEVIVLMPCGYTLDETVAEFRRLTMAEEWAKLLAVKKGRVYAVDANSYFSRPGPRLVTGVAVLARLLHPAQSTWDAPPGSVERV